MTDKAKYTPPQLDKYLGFEPRPFQKEVFEKLISTPRKTLLQLPPYRTYYGVDMAEKGGDRTVISQAKINGKGQIVQIVFDEFSTMPDYKWYRNPIKWWKWRTLWKRIEKQNKKFNRRKK